MMGREVEVDIINVNVTQAGRTLPGVQGKCTDCGHTTVAFGTGNGSRTRVLAQMRSTCPNNKGLCPQKNFYVEMA